MSKEAQLKLVDEDKIPGIERTSEWVEILNKIPEGKAWVTSEKELGVTVGHMNALVHRLIRKKKIPSTLKVIRRKQGDALVIYVLNSSYRDG